MYHLSATISLSLPVTLPLSPSGAVAPQEHLGIMDGLGDHITISKETWRQKHRTKKTLIKTQKEAEEGAATI